MKRLFMLACALAALCRAQSIDQQQTAVNTYVGARIGGSYFQTFTAGTTGTLVKVDVGFYASYLRKPLNTTVHVELWRGSPVTGAGGTLITSGDFPVSTDGTGTLNWNGFIFSVPVNAGQLYAVNIGSSSGTDPYGICADGLTRPYTAGRFGYIDPGTPAGAYDDRFSLAFRTWVQ